MSIRFRAFLTLVTSALLTGCASIDFDYPRAESTAIVDTDESYLGLWAAPLVATKPATESGFYALQDGIDALSARLLLAQRAQHSIDTQYYLIKTDTAGLAFIDSLLRAADRGVRVRLLVDDVFTKGYDAGMTGLDSHPNIEIRVFNPFNRGAAGKVWSGLTDLRRVNRRWHTKTCIAAPGRSVARDRRSFVISGPISRRPLWRGWDRLARSRSAGCTRPSSR